MYVKKAIVVSKQSNNANALKSLLSEEGFNDVFVMGNSADTKKAIEEDEYDKEILGEAQVYDDIYKQPARKTCATLFARGMGKLFHEKNS